jgi:hypothetical protein
MHDLLALYAKPACRKEPVICIDEKSLQLIGHSRQPLPMAPHAPTKEDYEYTRNGTTNLFVPAVESKAGQRIVSVTERRTKVDLTSFFVVNPIYVPQSYLPFFWFGKTARRCYARAKNGKTLPSTTGESLLHRYLPALWGTGKSLLTPTLV